MATMPVEFLDTNGNVNTIRTLVNKVHTNISNVMEMTVENNFFH